MTQTNESGATSMESDTSNVQTTNPSNNGNEESRTPMKTRDLAELVDKRLDEFEENAGLQKSIIREETENEVAKLLTMTPGDLREMDAVACAEAAVLLEEFAFHIQRAENRQKTRVNWANARIEKMIAPNLHKQPGYSHEERRAKAISQDDAAMATEQERLNAAVRLDRISYLSNRISTMAKRLAELASMKRGRT